MGGRWREGGGAGGGFSLGSKRGRGWVVGWGGVG